MMKTPMRCARSLSERAVGAVGRIALMGAMLVPATASAQVSDLEKSLAVLEFYLEGDEYGRIPQRVQAVANEIGRGMRSRPSPFTVVPTADAKNTVLSVMTTGSRRVTADKLREIEEMMKEGDTKLYTEPLEAIRILDKAKRELKSIMESISLNEKIRQDYFKAQMLLATSHFQNGSKDNSTKILEEVVRVFGDTIAVTEDDYHPGIVGLYRESFRKLEEAEKGSVSIETLPPGAELLVHGRVIDQQSPATVGGLYPGTATIQARKDGQESMVHKVEIEAGGTAKVTIDIEYETALAFNSKQFGFVFKNVKELQAKLPDFASRIGVLLKVEYIFVAGVLEKDGSPHLTGYLVNVKSRTIERSTNLKTFANVMSKNRIRQMANFVNDPKFRVEKVYRPWYTNWLGWTGVGIGVIGAAVGGIFWSDFDSKLEEVNSPCTPGGSGVEGVSCFNYDTRLIKASEANTSRTLAGVSWGIGGVALIGGVLAFLLIQEEDIDAGFGDSQALGTPRLRVVGPTMMPGGTPGVGATFTF